MYICKIISEEKKEFRKTLKAIERLEDTSKERKNTFHELATAALKLIEENEKSIDKMLAANKDFNDKIDQLWTECSSFWTLKGIAENQKRLVESLETITALNMIFERQLDIATEVENEED